MKVRTNWYSTPLKPGTRCQARLLPAYVEIWQERQCVARHERSFGRYEQVLDLEHYLDVLERKPGALAGSRPLQQWRERGRWPESFDRLWQSLEQRQGEQAGTRAMIELLQLGQAAGLGSAEASGRTGPGDWAARDAAAVRHLADFGELAHPTREDCELDRWTGTLRASAAGDERLRLAAGEAVAEVAR